MTPLATWRGAGLASAMLTLAACVEAPSTSTTDVIDGFLEDRPNTALDAACEDGATVVTWTVEAHPLIAGYEAIVATEDAVVERASLGFEAPGR